MVNKGQLKQKKEMYMHSLEGMLRTLMSLT